MQVLDNWCAQVGRNPNEIERSISLPSGVSISQLDAYLQAGATHLIAEVDPPWNFDFVRTLLRWRKEGLFVTCCFTYLGSSRDGKPAVDIALTNSIDSVLRKQILASFQMPLDQD
jgi:hypothetical protein